MFDTIIDVVRNFLGDITTAGKVILAAVALLSLIITGSTAIKALNSADFKKFGIFLVASILVIVVSVIVFVALRTIGKGTGSDINKAISSISMLTLVPAMYTAHRHKRKSLKQIEG